MSKQFEIGEMNPVDIDLLRTQRDTLWEVIEVLSPSKPDIIEDIFAFVIFYDIPTHWSEQYSNGMDRSGESAGLKSTTADFSFEYVNGFGEHRMHQISMSPKMNGTLLFFDGRINHHVNPFYDCDEDRITISGNVNYNTEVLLSNDDLRRQQQFNKRPFVGHFT